MIFWCLLVFLKRLMRLIVVLNFSNRANALLALMRAFVKYHRVDKAANTTAKTMKAEVSSEGTA